MTLLAMFTSVYGSLVFAGFSFSLLLSILFIVGGLYILKGNAFWTALWSNVRWQQVLTVWGVTVEQDTTVLSEVKRYWRIIRGYSLIGAGGLASFALLILFGESLLLPEVALVTTTLNGGVYEFVWVLALLMGYVGGYAVGFEYVRRTETHRIFYADTRQRHVSDYCSQVIRVLPVLLVLYNIVIAFLAQPYLCVLPIPLSEGSQLILQKNLFVPIAIPALMILLILLVEWFLVRVTSLPRVVVISEMSIAQRVDDIIRSVSIAQLVCLEYVISGMLTFAQFLLLQTGTQAPVYVSALQSLGWFFLILFCIGGCLLNTLCGRLGGSVSGWWWRTQDSAA